MVIVDKVELFSLVENKGSLYGVCWVYSTEMFFALA